MTSLGNSKRGVSGPTWKKPITTTSAASMNFLAAETSVSLTGSWAALAPSGHRESEKKKQGELRDCVELCSSK